jgi:hypothetical protein
MHPTPKSNAVDFYLLAKSFPDFEQYISKEGLMIGGLPEPDAGPHSEEILAEWKTLRSKSASERQALFEKSRAESLRLLEQERAIAMHLRDEANGPDFPWWGKYAAWTPREFAALSMGSDPNHVSWHGVRRERHWCPWASRLVNVHNMISRAVKVGDLPSPLRPAAAVRWAAGRLDLPPDLIDAVHAAPEPAAKYAEDPETLDQLDARRMKSWYKVVAGAVLILGYQPEKKQNSTAPRISGRLDEMGYGLDEGTVLSIIREAFKSLPSKLK